MDIYFVASIWMDSVSVPVIYQCCMVGTQSKFLKDWVIEQQNPLKDSIAEGFITTIYEISNKDLHMV